VPANVLWSGDGTERSRSWDKLKCRQSYCQVDLNCAHEAPQVFYFVDNDRARYATIAMFPPVVDAGLMLDRIAEADVAIWAINWYSRVSLFSNLADGPSRLDFGA
jgi:ferredoxin